MNRFLRIRTLEGHDLLLIDRELYSTISNNTNYNYTYYIHSDSINLGQEICLKGREDKEISPKYNMVLVNEPLNLSPSTNEIYITVSEMRYSTMPEYLGMKEKPLINIGDVNPYEHGFFLVDDNSEFDFYVTRIDKCPDTGKYIAFEFDVPKKDIEGDYHNLLDLENLDDYTIDIYTIKEKDIPLFFNIV